MTTETDITNRALQTFGSRTNVTTAELTAAFAGNNSASSNEAINASLILRPLRDQLIRLAPWNCVTKFQSLVFISSIAGTPENPNPGPSLWIPGQPIPPWSYEYQYPVDCLRARYIIPQYTTQAGGVPIFPAGTVTGAQQVGWAGPALKFTIATDQFFGVTSAAVSAPGSGYAVGDIITLAQPTFTTSVNIAPVGQPAVFQTVTMSVGAPAQLTVATLAGSGVATVTVINQIQGEGTAQSGSYFSTTGATPVAQGVTTGVGTGATFVLTFAAQQAQRTVLCNQEQAILCYNAQITDPNVMDPMFQEAWVNILGARLCFQLSGDKALANQCIATTNAVIMEARKVDGNEDITVNDVTPDFLRIRGNWGGPNWEYSPNMSFDWGSSYSPY